MKKFISKYLKGIIHNQYFEINEGEDKLIFQLKKGAPLFKKYLMIKHNRTGKRIIKEFKNSKAEVSAEELFEFEELGTFDIYLKMVLFNKEFLKRMKFNLQNGGKILVDHKNNLIFDPYKTAHYNLSFKYREAISVARATSLKKVDNHLVLNGEIELINDVDFDEIEIMIISENSRYYIHDCEFERTGKNVKFTSKLYFEISEKDLNTELEMFIRLKDKQMIVDDYGIKADRLAAFDKIDDKYFDYIENYRPADENNADDRICSLCYVSDSFNLVFNVTSKNYIKNLIRNEKKLTHHSINRDETPLVFFESFHGKSYSGQPKYIYEKMLELGYDKHYDFVWSYKGDLDIPGNPLITMRESKQYNYLLRTSNYWITNVSFPILKEDDDIVYLQTTHGTPYKKMGSDIDSSEENVNKGRVLIESGTWNYLLSPNDYSKDIFKRAFEYDGTVINKGYPANDIFYRDMTDKKNQLIRDLNIPKDKKIILYAPTYRDYDVDGRKNHQFNLLLDFKKLQEELSDDYVLIVRLHYILSKSLNLSDEFKDFIIDLSEYDDIADLYLISDMLITDYSSVFFDFAHSKKPMLFFVPDFEKYNSFRGLYPQVKENLPGPELYTNEELIEAIKNINQIENEYNDKYEAFYNTFCKYGHGDTSEEVIRIVFGGEKDE